MEKYKHTAVYIDRLPLTPMGIFESQCNGCTSFDCGHRVEYQTLSILGVNQKQRCVISSTGDAYMVTNCDGFTTKK